MTLRTRFTELFGCEAPVQLAPMSGVPTPDLIGAVIDAGGMGAVGAGTMPAPALAATLEQIRARTDGPLLINVLVPFLDDEFRAGWPDPDAWSRVLRPSRDAARAFDGDVVGELAIGTRTFPLPRLGPAPPLTSTTGAIEAMPMYAGESVRFVRAVEPAADIV